MKGESSSSVNKASVTNLSSALTEANVLFLMQYANISSTDFEFLVPKKEDRANKPPEGYISVYKQQIERGLRFPLHKLVVHICNRLKISPSQLTPDAHSVIVAFILCAKLYDIPITAECFFSFFSVCRYNGEMLFRFQQQSQFLVDISSVRHWSKRDFFFLRPVGGNKSWNCFTKWGEIHFLTPPRIDADIKAAFQKLALKSGMFKHHFDFAGPTLKDLLVLGGIEPPGPKLPQFTFRYLMHQQAVTKFQLQPEDIPRPNAKEKEKEKQLPADASKVPINVMPSSTSGDKVPFDELSHKVEEDCATAHNKANRAVLGLEEAKPQSTPPTLIADASKVPMKELFREGEEDRAEAHAKANCAVLGSEEAQPKSIPPISLALSKTLESICVPKEFYEKLEKEKHEVTTELTSTKSRVEELEQEIELYKAKRVDSDYKTTQAMVKVKMLEARLEKVKSDSDCLHDKIKKDAIEEYKSSHDFANAVQEEAVKYYENLEKEKQEVTLNLKSMISRVQELEQEIELYKAKRVNSDYKTSQAMVKAKMLEKRLETVKSDSDCFRDTIKKDVIEEFKSSYDFANAAQEEVVKYYVNGFDACKLRVLSSGKLLSGFNFDFLDVAEAEWGSSPGQVDNAVTDQAKKSLKRKKT